MAAHLEAVERICYASSKEKDILASPEAPIVILRKKASGGLAESVAPGMGTIGVMLPYTPVHHLLFDHGAVPVLVMTSANPSGLPCFIKTKLFLICTASQLPFNNREFSIRSMIQSCK